MNGRGGGGGGGGPRSGGPRGGEQRGGGQRGPRAPGSALRASATRVVNAVVTQGRSLDDALAHAVARHPITARDHALLAAIVYGVVRHYRRLGWQAERMLERPLRDAPLIEVLLRVGLYQLLDLRVPDHAAIAATTGAAPMLDAEWAGSLVNALLRRTQRERDALAEPEAPAIRHSCPDWLLARLEADWGEARAEQMIATANVQAPMTLRVNRRRMDPAAYRARLARAGMAADAVAGAPDAVVLGAPSAVDDLPGFARGSVSVQDASAQLAADLLDVASGQRVLDACAAPGGKAAHLLERCPDAALTALDVDRERLQQVDATLRRIGLRARLVAADACDTGRWWDGAAFDRILIDAPCSGTGVIRRHPDIKWLRRETDIAALATRQRALLDALWPLLAPGGRLVFATCSVLREEGADVVDAFVADQGDAVPATPDLPVGERDGPGWRIAPGGEWDGFFYALLERAHG
ncbi:16S rRNA (cytosine(967)-C(5))-methyltransferase RsmB [Algiphilus sp.]|uniref:16S rRNA (cytosine(967)-C(5))-methyltransferase RsmB n=1 Tax=Algiphilus sp. TaxID=1872431 RepID=UPI0025C1FCE4|nr:16S rRNA (cytosine(967)-C(5))-methyltransferase RsmB [Algiphilus sp.]MCK5770691.1 16S rRNA (cytosine(967)-C(5))-methyltransferase RsmB [Algiphilus sp.]